MSGVNEIRSAFLDYFARNGHEAVASSPLVPRNDPTLMFTNAGMVQFKNVFTGQEKRPYSRATTAQKCVRAGGKHNDLDNVGYTARHHTFFEMLGNFSFGDYFKPLAIELAWNLITKEFGLPRDKLLVTVYHDDDEAADLWKKIAGFTDSKIIRIPTSDNFWQMGDTGPCGPCSEIFIDQGDKLWGGPPGSPEEDGDRFLEFWNLVFMQYEQIEPGNRIGLPKPSIDTGMGLERISAIMQGVTSNYDTDLFRTLIEAVAHVTGVAPEGERKASHRVIADHLRASSFLVADGVLPSNEGRGYVLRRIMRRAMRHAQLLGATDPVMYRLVPALVREMGQAYPELVRAEALITETLKLEETRFGKTLERGLSILDEETRGLVHGQSFSGETAFTLYDTYGFPLDLTQDALKPRGITVDTGAFDAAMERQREKARAAWSGSGEAATDTVWYGVRERVGATEFLGYDTESAEGIVLALLKDGAEVTELKAGETGLVVMNQTPFYGESGGQVGDTGIMRGEGARVRVTGTDKNLGDLVVHEVVVEHGRAGAGTGPRTRRRSRAPVRRARQPLRHAPAARGAAPGPGRPCGPEGLAGLARAAALRLQPSKARHGRGGRAGRGDRQPGPSPERAGGHQAHGGRRGHRVRRAGPVRREIRRRGPGGVHGPAPRDAMGEGNRAFSVELCGGTHVNRTGDIGLVTIVSESAVGAGVRRLEAMTGDAARRHLAEESRRLHAVAGLLKAPVDEVTDRLGALIEDRRRLERDLADARRRIAMGGTGGSEEPLRDVGGIKLMARAISGVEMKDLKALADEGKKRLGSGIVAIVGVAEDGKAGIVVGVTEDLTSPVRRREPGPRRRREARRQGRRRPPRHGPGGRTRRSPGRRGARGHRGGSRGGLRRFA